MDYSSLLEIVSIDSSRYLVNVGSDYVGTDEHRFDEALDIAVNAKYPFNMRAARVIEESVRRYKRFAEPRLEYFISVLTWHTNDGVKRAFLKVIEGFLPFKVNDDLLGLVITICFDKLNGIETVSVKYYSINCLMKIVKREPDLKYELQQSLENQIGLNTVAFDRYIRKKINKL
jgi:hypothetical protein